MTAMKLNSISSNIKPVLEKLISRENLSEIEAYLVMKEILSGKVSQSQIASLLTGLRMKGESTDEIVGFIKAMRESMTRIKRTHNVIVDSCGTGGDSKRTFNISTASAFVVAGAGIAVAKHGNRSVTSFCGSADVLESYGVRIMMSKEQAEKCLKEIGITFLFAPLYHPAMKSVAAVRKELGIRTVFNLLGPLLNPAGVDAQVIGVARKEFVPQFAAICNKLNQDKNQTQTIVHEQGYDEIVLQGKSVVIEVTQYKSKFYSVSPKRFGLEKVKPREILGGNADQNAKQLKRILSGKEKPLEDVVVANAALLIKTAHRARALAVGRPNKALKLSRAVQIAQESIRSGSALKKLDDLASLSRETPSQ